MIKIHLRVASVLLDPSDKTFLYQMSQTWFWYADGKMLSIYLKGNHVKYH